VRRAAREQRIHPGPQRHALAAVRGVSQHFRAGGPKSRGIILADTKFEFGYALDSAGKPTTELMLIDEVLTPDSSRFWPADEYQPGRDQNSFDKQYVRNYLLGLVKSNQWSKQPPGPALPDEVVRNTLARYVEARDRLFAE
jgi:phosphoribosylaminoimidazole-succinocarboxamide synthase